MKAWRLNYSDAAADFGNSGNGYSGWRRDKSLSLVQIPAAACDEASPRG
jgi:hypothetical protein